VQRNELLAFCRNNGIEESLVDYLFSCGEFKYHDATAILTANQ
jgi:hypothetical protein